MNKTLSRLVIEATILVGIASVLIGLIQKVTHLSSIYTSYFLGLSAADFLYFGQLCFVMAIALAVRRLLKHIEFALQDSKFGQNIVDSH